MSFKVTAVLAMLAAALVFVAGAGAGTSPAAAPEALDLSSLTKIKTYLRSIGVNPKSVVIQRGKRNYAGPNCPGRGWSCTTRTRVLQVGSVNQFECTGGTQSNTGGAQTCVGLVQEGDRNTFRCIQKTSGNPAVQRCSVTQAGSWNYARFEQVADQSTNTAVEQDATQIVEVHQQGTGSTPKNEVHVFQRIKQSMTTPGSQTQDGHQVVRPATGFTNIQDASGAGNNYADIHQYMDQRASGAAETQEQNTEPLPTDPAVTDCVPTGLGPTTPNQCVEGSQSTGPGGQNHSQVHQLIDQDAKSTLEANQTQGHFSGGIDTSVHQTVGGATGSSNSAAHQAMRQNVEGAEGSIQFQIDPTSCCGVSQEGGDNNSQNMRQGGSQKSDANTSQQDLTLIGQCNTQNGTCSVTHQARNDEDHANYSCGSANDPCPPLSVTSCESTELGGNEGSGQCFTPDDTVCVECVIFTEASFLPGTTLTGFEVTMGLIEPSLALGLP